MPITFNRRRGIKFGLLAGGLVAGILGAVFLGIGMIPLGSGIGFIAAGFGVAGATLLATIGTKLYKRHLRKKTDY